MAGQPNPNSDIPQTDSNNGPYEGKSIRWKHFHTSFKLVSKKASAQWTFEDLAKCLPEGSASDPEAHGLWETLSQGIYEGLLDRGQDLFEAYEAAERIDVFHQTIVEARARKTADPETVKDVWKENIDPKTAVRARLVPVLQSERDRLRAVLADLEVENERLTNVLVENKQKRQENDALASQWLDKLDGVAAAFSALPEEEMVQWAIEAEESGP